MTLTWRSSSPSRQATLSKSSLRPSQIACIIVWRLLMMIFRCWATCSVQLLSPHNIVVWPCVRAQLAETSCRMAMLHVSVIAHTARRTSAAIHPGQHWTRSAGRSPATQRCTALRSNCRSAAADQHSTASRARPSTPARASATSCRLPLQQVLAAVRAHATAI